MGSTAGTATTRTGDRMTRLVGRLLNLLLLVLVGWALIVLTGRAVDHEIAQASAGGPKAVSPPSVRSPVSQAGRRTKPASPAVGSSRAASIRAIRQVFRGRAAAAIRVASCETGGTFDARAANWTDRHSDGSRGSFGLFQIGALHRDKLHGETVSAFARRMFNPVANSRVAYRMSRGGTNWRAWSCQP